MPKRSRRIQFRPKRPKLLRTDKSFRHKPKSNKKSHEKGGGGEFASDLTRNLGRTLTSDQRKISIFDNWADFSKKHWTTVAKVAPFAGMAGKYLYDQYYRWDRQLKRLHPRSSWIIDKAYGAKTFADTHLGGTKNVIDTAVKIGNTGLAALQLASKFKGG